MVLGTRDLSQHGTRQISYVSYFMLMATRFCVLLCWTRLMTKPLSKSRFFDGSKTARAGESARAARDARSIIIFVFV